MSTIRQTDVLPLAKGCEIRFMVDDAKPTDAVDGHWADTIYDGKPDSWVPEIPRHWHKHHDERMKVVYGRVTFTLDSETIVLTPEMGELFIPRLHVHSLKFFPGEAASYTEMTDPAETEKREFFANVFSDGVPTFSSSMRAFYDGDTYLELPGRFRIVEEAFTMVVGGAMKYLYPRKSADAPSASK